MPTTKVDRRTFLLAPALAGLWPALARGAGISPLVATDGRGAMANEEDGIFDGRKLFFQIQLYPDASLFHLVLNQGQALVDHAIQVHLVEGRRRRAGEVQERIDDLAGRRKVCLAIFSSSRDFGSSPDTCLASIWA